MGMLGDETEDKTMPWILQKRVLFLSPADILWGLRVLVCVAVGFFCYFVRGVEKYKEQEKRMRNMTGKTQDPLRVINVFLTSRLGSF